MNTWKSVWVDRDEERSDWNGYEACFTSEEQYEEFVTASSSAVISLLKIGPNDRVLDLGCGTGRLTYAVAQCAREVVGLDFSPTVLEVAQDLRSGVNITYQEADLNTVDPTQLVGFDKVFAFGALMYLDSQATAFGLVQAVVQSGARVLLLDMPDASIADSRPRAYDRERFPHLRFSEDAVLQQFPGAVILRGLFPTYANNDHRFAVLIGAD